MEYNVACSEIAGEQPRHYDQHLPVGARDGSHRHN
jgi:hypothetical protein